MIYIHLSLVLKNTHNVLLEVQNDATSCVLCEVRSKTQNKISKNYLSPFMS